MSKIFFESLIKILDAIEDNCIITDVAKKTDMTYSHVAKIIEEMERRGLIITMKIGRKRVIQLSEQGYKFKRLILSSAKFW